MRCAMPGTEVSCAMSPLCSARSISQSARTPPPSPPMAKIAIVIGRVLVSNGAFIADFSGLCRQQLPTCQSLLQEPDYGVAHAGLEAIPPGRIVDDGSPVERRAQHR